MVHEVDRSWLETVIAETIRGPADGSAVVDPDRLAPAMTTDQRTAIRALLVGLSEIPAFVPGSLGVTLERDEVRAFGELDASFAPPDPAVRSLLAPYLAVIRVVFPASDVELSSTALTVRFQYDEH